MSNELQTSRMPKFRLARYPGAIRGGKGSEHKASPYCRQSSVRRPKTKADSHEVKTESPGGDLLGCPKPFRRELALNSVLGLVTFSCVTPSRARSAEVIGLGLAASIRSGEPMWDWCG